MKKSALTTHSIQTSSGRISYIEAGSGPVAAICPRCSAEQASLASPAYRTIRYSPLYRSRPAGTWRYGDRARPRRLRDRQRQHAERGA